MLDGMPRSLIMRLLTLLCLVLISAGQPTRCISSLSTRTPRLASMLSITSSRHHLSHMTSYLMFTQLS
uniref:Calnexin n=1 Tax=Arundo donax TaxID=35708 RepID=A0A0A9CNY6_ARUDO